MAKVGVFICHCGSNIAGVVDVTKVKEEIAKLRKVYHCIDYKYMCSDPGQLLIKEAIKQHNLNRIVVAACSPRMHELTFRRCLAEANLNPYLFEMANIREHCSWVHPDDGKRVTEKAIELTNMAVSKVLRHKELYPNQLPITKKVLIIGGGIAGIQAALDCAAANIPTILVERTPSIGGRMAQLDKTFPTLDCSACILTPKMVDIQQNKNITLYSYSEVEEVSGFIGNFKVKIRKKARYVDEEKCTGCGICIQKCPMKKILSEFDEEMGTRPAIYTPFPQAVPNIPVIDKQHCTYFKSTEKYRKKEGLPEDAPVPADAGKCKICEKVCEAAAIDFQQRDEIIEEEVGAIIVATGFDTFDAKVYKEYGYGSYKDVITSLQFERLINASGPTGGHIKRPSDNQEPKKVAFVQCVGSRDETKNISYCSRVCCMYTAKHTILLKEHIKDATAYVFYMDIRAAGKDYEEFVKRAQEEYNAIYIRGRVGRIYPQNGKLIIKCEDTLIGEQLQVEVDLVVLATGIIPRYDAKELARKLNISANQYGFFTEAHPKLRPVETLTDGVYLAGVCQGVRDIPDSVAQGTAAAGKVAALFSQDTLTAEALISEVDKLQCVGCLACKEVCPFNAIEEEVLDIKPEAKIVAKVNEGICKGCGLCVATCKSKAIRLHGFEDYQILKEIEVLTYV